MTTLSIILLALAMIGADATAPVDKVQDQPGRASAVVQAGTRTLVDVGSLADGTYILTIKAGVLTFEPVQIVYPGPTPPDPVDLRQKLATAITHATDPKKAETAAAFVKAIQGTIQGVRDGKIAKDSVIALIAAAGTSYAGWSEFLTTLTGALKATTTGPAAADILQVAADELGKVK